MKLILSTGVLYTHNKLRSGVSVIDCVVECYVHHTGIETVFENQNSGWVEMHRILISLHVDCSTLKYFPNCIYNYCVKFF